MLRRRTLLSKRESEDEYKSKYFNIVSLADNNKVYLYSTYSNLSKTVSVSTDNGATWAQCTVPGNGYIQLATLNTGEKVLVKGNNNTYSGNVAVTRMIYFRATDPFNLEGNIMSLIYGDNFVGQETLTSSNNAVFSHLFYQATYLRSAENLILPATTLSANCYRGMFSKSGLTIAPALPAETLASGSYIEMFEGCGLLHYIKCLLKGENINLGNGAYWVSNVPSTGTFVKHPDSTWVTGDSGIPSGWTVEDATL